MSVSNIAQLNFLHAQIIRGKAAEVKKFISKYVVDKHLFNSQHISAVKTAISYGQFEIYEILLSKRFSLGSHEDLEEVLENSNLINHVEKRQLRDIHKKFFKNSSPAHLTLLQEKSKLNHDSSESDRRIYQPQIAKAFEELNEINWIEPILKIAASSPNLRIIFDCNHETVEHSDPTKDKTVLGTTYSDSALILIGALKLTDCYGRFEVYGTLAHELTHFVIKVVYNNSFKPYLDCEKIKIKRFAKILVLCKIRQHFEDIIRRVFISPIDIQHAELIVRVPHILAVYKNHPEKLTEMFQTYSELFKYFEDIVLVDIEKKSIHLEVKTMIDKINDTTGILRDIKSSKMSIESLSFENFDKISLIVTNCCELTVQALHQKHLLEDSLVIFTTISDLKNEKTFSQIVEAFNLDRKTTLVINCEHSVEKDVNAIASTLRGSSMTQNVIFISNLSLIIEAFIVDMTEIIVNHAWSQLTQVSQEILLNHLITFQGREIQLGKLLSKASSAFDLISLVELIRHKKICIGKEVKFDEIKFHIDRKFLPSTIKSDGENEDFENDAEDLLHYVEHKLILLSDKPGNGKTVELKMMALKLKAKFPLNWVIFLDLKKYTFAYDKCAEIESTDNAVTFIAKKLLQLNSMEQEVLKNLFDEGRVVLLFDGFDEISPNFKHFVLSLIVKIKSSENFLWVSTRTHLESELQRELNTAAFRMKSLSKTDQETFFINFLRSKGFFGEKLDEKVNKNLNFVDTLEKLSKDFIFNPLLLQMIGEINCDDSSPLSVDCSFYTIYERFFKLMLQNCMSKGPVVQEDLADFMLEVKSFHQIKALKKVFHNSEEIDEIIEMCFDDYEPPTVEKMTRIGLMFADSLGTFQFIHQTFAEFFIADFLLNIVLKQNVKKPDVLEIFSNFLLKILTMPDYKMIRTFINDVFGRFDLAKDNRRFDTLKKLVERFFIDDQNFDIFYLYVEENFFNIIKMITLSVKTDKRVLNKLWHTKNCFGYTLWVFAIDSNSIEFIKNLVLLAEEHLDRENIRDLAIETLNGNGFVFDTNLEKIIEVTKFFIVKMSKWLTLDEKVNLMLIQDQEVKSLFKNAHGYQTMDTLDTDFIAVFIKNWGHACVRYFFKEQPIPDNEESLLFYICNHCTLDQINTFCQRLMMKVTQDEFRRIFRKACNYGVTPTMFAATNKNENAFKVFMFYADKVFDLETWKKVLLEEDRRNYTVLHRAARNECLKNFDEVKHLYLSSLSIENLKDLTLKQNSDGENIFFVALRTSKNNCKTVEALWHFLHEVFSENELKTFLKTQNKKGKTVFSLALKHEKIKFLTDFVDATFNDEEMKNIGIS